MVQNANATTSNKYSNSIEVRYLELAVGKGKVPKSIKKIKNLETLMLSTDSETTIPDVIWKLKSLRHLILNSTRYLRLDTLSHLQTLKGIQAGTWIEDGSLDNIANLQRLFIQDLSGDLVELVISIVAKRLQRLQTLSLKLMIGTSFAMPAMKQLCDCKELEKLCLSGRVETLPPYLPGEFPPNLVKLGQ